MALLIITGLKKNSNKTFPKNLQDWYNRCNSYHEIITILLFLQRCCALDVPLFSVLVKLSLGLLLEGPDVLHGHTVPLVSPAEQLGEHERLNTNTNSSLSGLTLTCLWKFVNNLFSVDWMKLSTLDWRPHLEKCVQRGTKQAVLPFKLDRHKLVGRHCGLDRALNKGDIRGDGETQETLLTLHSPDSGPRPVFSDLNNLGSSSFL